MLEDVQEERSMQQGEVQLLKRKLNDATDWPEAMDQIASEREHLKELKRDILASSLTAQAQVFPFTTPHKRGPSAHPNSAAKLHRSVGDQDTTLPSLTPMPSFTATRGVTALSGASKSNSGASRSQSSDPTAHSTPREALPIRCGVYVQSPDGTTHEMQPLEDTSSELAAAIRSAHTVWNQAFTKNDKGKDYVSLADSPHCLERHTKKTSSQRYLAVDDGASHPIDHVTCWYYTSTKKLCAHTYTGTDYDVVLSPLPPGLRGTVPKIDLRALHARGHRQARHVWHLGGTA